MLWIKILLLLKLSLVVGLLYRGKAEYKKLSYLVINFYKLKPLNKFSEQPKKGTHAPYAFIKRHKFDNAFGPRNYLRCELTLICRPHAVTDTVNQFLCRPGNVTEWVVASRLYKAAASAHFLNSYQTYRHFWRLDEPLDHCFEKDKERILLYSGVKGRDWVKRETPENFYLYLNLECPGSIYKNISLNHIFFVKSNRSFNLYMKRYF